MGNADTSTCTTIPGVKLVAACDLYDGRLNDIKKKYGNDIFTTKRYEEILSRKDIDGVIIATPDHWHQEISIAAMNAGKAVYCEKPMVHDITEGGAVVDAQTKNKSIFQVGSQGMSSLAMRKQKNYWKPALLERSIMRKVSGQEIRRAAHGSMICRQMVMKKQLTGSGF